MPGLDVNQSGIVSRVLPNPTADGNLKVGPRFLRYGEQAVTQFVPTLHGLADEGTYFITNDGTANLGTGIAFGGAAITAFNDTTGAGMAIVNSDAVGGKRIYLDYLKLSIVTKLTGTQAAPWPAFVGRLDSLATRYTSGGTAFTPQNINMDSSTGTIAKVYFGALTLAAGSASARTINMSQPRGPIAQVSGDQYLFTFGSVEKAISGLVLTGTTAILLAVNFGPVTIGPGQVFSLHSYCGGQTGAAIADFELGHWER